MLKNTFSGLFVIVLLVSYLAAPTLPKLMEFGSQVMPSDPQTGLAILCIIILLIVNFKTVLNILQDLQKKVMK